jgi:Flp pilus assembly protein TadG
VVPVLISFYLMLNETANGMRASRKVTMVSRVIADLATRPSDLTTAMQNDIFNAATPIMNPFTTSQMSMRLTSIRFVEVSPGTVRGTVDWSIVRGSSLGAFARCTPVETVSTSTGVAIPDSLKAANTSLVLAESTIPYKPAVGELITGDIDLRDRLIMRPRISEYVTLNGTANPPCP